MSLSPSTTAAMRSAIQKVATGPEYSKDLTQEEALAAMQYILSDKMDPVQAAVFFIALRMKRETDDENKGVLKAIIDTSTIAEAEVDELVDVAAPYDGHSRGLPVCAFTPAVLAALEIPAVCHGLEAVGPKYGITNRKVLRAAGIDTALSPEQAAAKIAQQQIGWAYVDQAAYAPKLHDLITLRSRIIKRQVITTVEVLVGPIRARNQTHLLTGYVHKAYPPIYAELARFAGFDSAMIVRGVEGGVIPSLQQPAKIWSYHDKGEESAVQYNPTELNIHQSTRAVPIPRDLPPPDQSLDQIAIDFDVDAGAEAAARAGIDALEGKAGPARDSLVYSAAIVLNHLGKADSLQAAADQVRQVLDSGKALAHFNAHKA